MSPTAIKVMDAIKPSTEITAPVTAAINELVTGGAVSSPVEYDWQAILDDDQRNQALKWADEIDPAEGDLVISGFAADIMAEIKEKTKQVLRDTAVRDTPEANAVLSAFLDDLGQVDYNFNFTTPGVLQKVIDFVTFTKDRLAKFLTSIKSIDSKLENMEATIATHIYKLTNFLSVLQNLKNEYKAIVPWMFAATYTMQVIVKREEGNLEILKATAKKFRADHNGQANSIMDEAVNEKTTQLDLCRQRLFQLAFQAAKGFIMVPCIEMSMKAARIVKLEMENTINSTMADIRATLTVIIAQSAIEDAVKIQEKSDAVARAAQEALAARLERTAGCMERMNLSKEKNLVDLKAFAVRVNAAIVRTQEYSAGLMKNVSDVNTAMDLISKQYNDTLMGAGSPAVITTAE